MLSATSPFMISEGERKEVQKKIMRNTTVRRDFRHFLQDQLSARCAKNPNFSLRSFAKMLDISPSALSGILNGKRAITEKMKQRLSLKLGLSVEHIQSFMPTPHGNTRHRAAVIPQFEPLSVDKFSVISDPLHYALLELIKTENFCSDARWIAKRLKKTVSEINFCIERLERVGLISRDENGELHDSTSGFTTDIREGFTSEAQRQFQARSLEHGIEALQTVSHELRDNTSMTMAINAEDLPLAKKMIKEFRQVFCKTLESNPKLTEVYQMTICLVPLTCPKGNDK